MTAPEHDASRRPQSRFAAAAVEKTAMQHAHLIKDNTFIVVQHCDEVEHGWLGQATYPWRMVAWKGNADFRDLFAQEPTTQQLAQFMARAEAFFTRLPVDLPVTMVDDPTPAPREDTLARMSRRNVEMRGFLLSLLNPEQFGYAVTAEVRDEARALLGMQRVETATK